MKYLAVIGLLLIAVPAILGSPFSWKRCPEHQIRTPGLDGICVTPINPVDDRDHSDEHLEDGIFRVFPPEPCAPGYKEIAGECFKIRNPEDEEDEDSYRQNMNPDKAENPEDLEELYREIIKNKCPPGSIEENGKCRKVIDNKFPKVEENEESNESFRQFINPCPFGYRFIYGKCVPVDDLTSRQIIRGPCKRGYKKMNGRCRRIVINTKNIRYQYPSFRQIISDPCDPDENPFCLPKGEEESFRQVIKAEPNGCPPGYARHHEEKCILVFERI